MKEGLGIERLPTTAMTLMPIDPPDEAVEPMRTLVRNAQIQRAVIAFARSMPETAATRLQDYGVSLVTSTEPGRNAARARLELRERAQRFQTFVKERFHVRSIVGIGRTLAPGAPLHPSHREAILALHMCAQLEKDVLFYDEHAGRLDPPLRRAAPGGRRPGRGLRARERRRHPPGQRQIRAARAELLGRPDRGHAQPVPVGAVPAARPASSAATPSAPRRATASPTTSWASWKRRSRCTR